MKNAKAQILITALIVMFITISLGLVFLFYSRSLRGITRIQVDADRAYSAAKSGIEMAVNCFNDDPCKCNVDGTTTLDSSTNTNYALTVVGTQTPLSGGRTLVNEKITSEGASGRSRRKLEESLEFIRKGLAKAYGGGLLDRLLALQQIPDGGYILGGRTRSFGVLDNDAFLIKATPDGALQWARTYGGALFDSTHSLRQTSDGGYILGGYTQSFGAENADFLLIKAAADGALQWAKTYGGTNYDRLEDLQQTFDGGYILGGYSDSFSAAGDSDFFLIKTDSDGVSQWAKTYGGTDTETLWPLQQTDDDGDGNRDDGYILGGRTSSFGAGNDNFFLIKTATDGALQWARTYEVTTWNYLFSLQQTSDGGYILGGRANPFGAGNDEFFLIKTAADGVLQWAKTYGGTNDDSLEGFQQTSDGGYILGGYTLSFGAENADFLLIKAAADGALQWAKTYGGTNYDRLTDLQQTSDGGYILGGYTQSFGAGEDFIFIKTDSQGNITNCCVPGFIVQEDPGSGTDNPSIDNFTVTVSTVTPAVAVVTPAVAVVTPAVAVVTSSVSVREYPDSNGNPSDDFAPTTTNVCPQ